jgi:enoyl-CoA hydratase/carnithine racemase|tara:strand:+ start:1746 stop:2519 length:774 start_codon:yes stop_codon:yes gene_type:complete
LSDHINIETTDSVLTIGINRPEKKNALNGAMYFAVRDALIAGHDDQNVRAVIIYGLGGDFTAGNDLKEFLEFSSTDQETFPAKEFLDVLIPYSKPVIAAVDGLAVGIGATMTIHCDLVYASEGARFQMPFVNLGLNPEAGSSYALPQLIGYHNAAEVILLGGMVTAKRAYDMGFVNAVVKQSELMDTAMTAAQRITELPPGPIRLAKSMMKKHFNDKIMETNEHEFNSFLDGLSSPEAGEAVRAFMEKRKPDFSRFQ